MNPKTVVILVLVLGVAGLAYVLTRSGQSNPIPDDAKRPADASNPEPSLLSDELLGNKLRSITFDGGQQGTLLALERDKGTWWVTKPSRFKANTNVIDELLTTLGTLTGSPTEDGPSGLVPDSPGLLLGHGLQTTQLFFNARLGAGRAAVTMIQDGVYTDYNATDTLHEIFDTLDIDRFYAKAFDPPLMPDIGRIDIRTPEGSSTLVQEDGRWWIKYGDRRERALETDLDENPGVQTYFELFKTELIEKQSSTPANGMASYGLKDPLISVRLIPYGKDPGQAYELHIGTPADPQDQTRYVSNGSLGQATYPVFTMPTHIALAFGQDATVFRDPRIFTTPISLFSAIILTNDQPQADKTPTLIKIDQMLLFEERFGQPTALDPKAVSAMLRDLQACRPINYVTMYKTQARRIKLITITPKLDGDPETFEILTDPSATANNPTVLIRRGVEPVALQVPRAAVAGLLDPSTLVSRAR